VLSRPRNSYVQHFLMLTSLEGYMHDVLHCTSQMLWAEEPKEEQKMCIRHVTEIRAVGTVPVL
jgi:hypothetical protein